jgi:hypothetical protein
MAALMSSPPEALHLTSNEEFAYGDTEDPALMNWGPEGLAAADALDHEDEAARWLHGEDSFPFQ